MSNEPETYLEPTKHLRESVFSKNSYWLQAIFGKEFHLRYSTWF